MCVVVAQERRRLRCGDIASLQVRKKLMPGAAMLQRLIGKSRMPMPF
jgi:hypothetical protein